jgi:hypothetical protein
MSIGNQDVTLTFSEILINAHAQLCKNNHHRIFFPSARYFLYDKLVRVQDWHLIVNILLQGLRQAHIAELIQAHSLDIIFFQLRIGSEFLRMQLIFFNFQNYQRISPQKDSTSMKEFVF